MLQWEIDGKKRWLCRDCTRMNTHIFLHSQVRLLAVVEPADTACSCCDAVDGRRKAEPAALAAGNMSFAPAATASWSPGFGARLQKWMGFGRLKIKKAQRRLLLLPAWLAELWFWPAVTGSRRRESLRRVK